MNIINIEHISKIYGEKTVFDDASFGIQQGDKIGIVGINGVGKSTVLRMIAGEEVPDSGQIIRQNGLKLAYMPQNPELPEEKDIRSWAFDGNDVEAWQVESNLTELGITDFDEKIGHLSGGQKRRVVLAKVLAADFDVLLMDEPTNHLDGEMIIWLEEYLRAYRGTLVMVTHDRYFLDRVSSRILEISHGKMYGYDSDYSGFLELKAAREEMELASERKRQSVLRMELEWAKRGCRARSTKQKARLERLEALKNGKAPVRDQTVELDSVETRMGKKTIEFHRVSKSYGEKKILEDFSYIVLKNQRLGIIGANGCGKSTILKAILQAAGVKTPDGTWVESGLLVKGMLRTGSGLVISYVPQDTSWLRGSLMEYGAALGLEAPLFLALLAKLDVPREQFAMPMETFSEGQKKKVLLAASLCTRAHLYVWDEPLNYIDVYSRIQIENLIRTWNPSILLVEHDQMFTERIGARTVEVRRL